MAVEQPRVKLNSGVDMPAVGLGTWKSKPGEVTQAVKDAIDAGYRHIDGAHIYQNEAEVGAAIKAKIEEGVIKREDVFLTSKLWNTYHRPDMVEKGCRKTLEDLGLEYLDLYLIHWPMAWKDGEDLSPKDEDGKILYSDVDLVDTWKAMEKLLDTGLVKSIGVSNFNTAQLTKVLENGTIVPAMNQVECHPYLNQSKLIDFCKSKNITVTAYSPFGSPDRPWAEAGDPKPLEDPKLIEIGAKYGKSPAQVIIRWMVQRGVVVIPKSVTKERIIQNFNVFDFELTADDIAAVDGLNRNYRALELTIFKDHPEYPFHLEA